MRRIYTSIHKRKKLGISSTGKPKEEKVKLPISAEVKEMEKDLTEEPAEEEEEPAEEEKED